MKLPFSSLLVITITAICSFCQPTPPLLYWQYGYGGTNLDIGNCVQQTPDGGYIITGGHLVFMYWMTALLKTESFGIEEWHRYYGGPSSDGGNCVIITSDGGYLTAGYYNESGYLYQLYLLKTDTQGNIQWERLYGGALNDEAECVIELPDGGYILTGKANGWFTNLYENHCLS